MTKCTMNSIIATGLAGVVIFFSACRRENATLQKASDYTQPRQAAQAFFGALSQEDWTKAQVFWSASLSPIDDRAKSVLGGLQLVKLDEPRKKQPPFRVGVYEGPWQSGDGDPWIPYEIRTKSGVVRNGDLRLSWTGTGWQMAGGL